MSLTADTGWLLALFLVATRVAGVLLFTPVLGFATLPARIRVMFVLALSAVLLIAVSVDTTAMVRSDTPFVLAALAELLLGGAMGFGILATFGAFMVGGRLLDYQMGFGVAMLFDPSSRIQSPLMGTLLTMLGAVLFLALDAHHTLIRALAYSLTAVPVGTLHVFEPRLLLQQFGLQFTYGLVLVAPPVVALLFVDMAVAFAARVMPQVNAYFVSLPIKVFVGLFVTALSLRFMGPYIAGMYDGISRYWQQVLA
jgi:flagellar biosynthesis protein FliR